MKRAGANLAGESATNQPVDEVVCLLAVADARETALLALDEHA